MPQYYFQIRRASADGEYVVRVNFDLLTLLKAQYPNMQSTEMEHASGWEFFASLSKNQVALLPLIATEI
jgi:hypothetical protein